MRESVFIQNYKFYSFLMYTNARDSKSHRIRRMTPLSARTFPYFCLDLLYLVYYTNQLVRSTSSSAVVTLQRLSNSFRLEISNKCLYFQAPVLWNGLSHHLHSHSPLKSILFFHYLLDFRSSLKLTFPFSLFNPFLLGLSEQADGPRGQRLASELAGPGSKPTSHRLFELKTNCRSSYTL